MLYGLRKLIVTILGMGAAVALLLTGNIDQEVFKWMMNVTMVAYLSMNAVSKIVNKME